jgi:hypothetical protein
VYVTFSVAIRVKIAISLRYKNTRSLSFILVEKKKKERKMAKNHRPKYCWVSMKPNSIKNQQE